MNLQARIDRYKTRPSARSSRILVLHRGKMRRHSSTAFPSAIHLIWRGPPSFFYERAATICTHETWNLLAPNADPRARRNEDVVRSSIQSIGRALGLGQLEFTERHRERPASSSSRSSPDHRALFSIDLPASAGMSWRPTSSRGNCQRSRKIVATPSATICCFRM